MKNLTELILILIAAFILQACHHGPDLYYTLPRTKKPIKIDDTPDSPISFASQQFAWFAIPTDKTDLIAKTLGLSDVKKCNWKSGLEVCDKSWDSVFVSPPVDGWTFVLANSMGGYSNRHVIFILAKVFPVFSCYYKLGKCYSWIKVESGRISRAFSMNSSTTYMNRGDMTPEEIGLNFRFYNYEGLTREQMVAHSNRTDLRLPEEEDVLNIAKKWSRSITDLETSTTEGVGLIGTNRKHKRKKRCLCGSELEED